MTRNTFRGPVPMPPGAANGRGRNRFGGLPAGDIGRVRSVPYIGVKNRSGGVAFSHEGRAV
jgi:hypothetical protein